MSTLSRCEPLNFFSLSDISNLVARNRIILRCNLFLAEMHVDGVYPCALRLYSSLCGQSLFSNSKIAHFYTSLIKITLCLPANPYKSHDPRATRTIEPKSASIQGCDLAANRPGFCLI